MHSFAFVVLKNIPWNVLGEDIAVDRLSEARISDTGRETKRGGGHGGRRVGRMKKYQRSCFLFSEISVIAHDWTDNEIRKITS